MTTATVGGGCRAPRTDPAMATAGCQRSSTSRGAGSAEGSEPHWHPGSCCICSIAPRRAPEVGRPRLRPGRTLTGFEARGCRRQLRGCDRPKNLGHSLRLTGPIKTWVIPPEEVKQRPAVVDHGHFKNAHVDFVHFLPLLLGQAGCVRRTFTIHHHPPSSVLTRRRAPRCPAYCTC